MHLLVSPLLARERYEGFADFGADPPGSARKKKWEGDYRCLPSTRGPPSLVSGGG